MDEDQKATDRRLYAFNPETRRYILRSGPTYARLVKRGLAEDPALVAQWAAAKEATRQAQIERAREARALGIGICGGVLPEATRANPGVSRLPSRVAQGARPDNVAEVRRPDARAALREIALENRDALCREGLTREAAEALLRRAYEATREG